MLSAKMHLDYLRRMGRFPEQAPPKIFIFCFVGNFFREVLRLYRCEPYQSPFASVYRLADYPGVAVGNFKIGAAVNAQKMEQLIVWGVQEFYAIGLAGAIDPDLRPGDLVLAEEALREEGVSRHYLEPGDTVKAPGASLSRFEKVLEGTAYRKGVILSHDAIYGMKEEVFRKRRKEGVLAVEMETAALYAVGTARNAPIATALAISDFEGPNGWEIAFHDPKVLEGQLLFLRALLQALDPLF